MIRVDPAQLRSVNELCVRTEVSVRDCRCNRVQSPYRAATRWSRARVTLTDPFVLRLFAASSALAIVSVRRGWPVFCPFRRITGRRCPLCGVSTTLVALIDGDLVTAKRANYVVAFAAPRVLRILRKERRYAESS